MRGVTRRLAREGEMTLAVSWQTAAFTGQAMNGKLKALGHYRKRARHGPQMASNAEIVARFGRMAKRGMAVAIN